MKINNKNALRNLAPTANDSNLLTQLISKGLLNVDWDKVSNETIDSIGALVIPEMLKGVLQGIRGGFNAATKDAVKIGLQQFVSSNTIDLQPAPTVQPAPIFNDQNRILQEILTVLKRGRNDKTNPRPVIDADEIPKKKVRRNSIDSFGDIQKILMDKAKDALGFNWVSDKRDSIKNAVVQKTAKVFGVDDESVERKADNKLRIDAEKESRKQHFAALNDTKKQILELQKSLANENDAIKKQYYASVIELEENRLLVLKESYRLESEQKQKQVQLEQITTKLATESNKDITQFNEALVSELQAKSIALESELDNDNSVRKDVGVLAEQLDNSLNELRNTVKDALTGNHNSEESVEMQRRMDEQTKVLSHIAENTKNFKSANVSNESGMLDNIAQAAAPALLGLGTGVAGGGLGGMLAQKMGLFKVFGKSADAATTATTARAATRAAEGGVLKNAAKSMSGKGGILGVGISAAFLASDFIDINKEKEAGQITEREADAKKGGAAGSALGGGLGFWGGAAIGQTLIPIPIVGGLIGGMVGSFLGSEAGGALGSKITDAFAGADEIEKNVKPKEVGRRADDLYHTSETVVEKQAQRSEQALNQSANIIDASHTNTSHNVNMYQTPVRNPDPILIKLIESRYA